MTSSTGKTAWRRSLLAARRARSVAARMRAREAIAAHLFDGSLLTDKSGDPNPIIARPESSDHVLAGQQISLSADKQPTICAYLPLASEALPDGLPELLAGRGWRVLLPVAVTGEPLDWAEWQPTTPLTRNSIGVLEPTGSRLGPQEAAQADVILVPALAVDAEGYRLGRGGGFYDRTLPLAGPRAALIAVVYDDEYVDALPHEPHDARVTHVLTPARGLRAVR